MINYECGITGTHVDSVASETMHPPWPFSGSHVENSQDFHMVFILCLESPAFCYGAVFYSVL